MKRILAVACFCVCATFVLSQAPATKSPAAPAAAGPTKDPVATSLRMLLQRSQNNTVGAIEAMPADKFSYKPTPDQIPFAHLVVHIASSNNFFAPKRPTFRLPRSTNPKRLTLRINCRRGQGVLQFLQRRFEQDGRFEIGRQRGTVRGKAISSSHGRVRAGEWVGRSLRSSGDVFEAEWNSAAERSTEEIERKALFELDKLFGMGRGLR